MSSHWITPAEEHHEDLDLEESRRLTILLEQTLAELLRKPDFNSVVASAKAWSRGTWFTSDGERFYFRDHETNEPDMDLPPSTREEVITLTQEEYRRYLRYTRLYDRFLLPKIQQIMDSELSTAQKIDRVYWIRLRFPAHVACRVPVVFDGKIDRFCWGWDYYKHQEGYEPSPSQQKSDQLINHLFVDTSILWSY